MTNDTKRNWNWRVWAGFALVLAGLLTYIPIFALFPATRDFPWVNLLLLAAGLALLGVGLARAYRRPRVYRGKVCGTALAALGLLGTGLFCYGLFYVARQLPASTAAPHVGATAPDFTLPDQDGAPVALADLLAAARTAPAAITANTPSPARAGGGVLLIFYRGHW